MSYHERAWQFIDHIARKRFVCSGRYGPDNEPICYIWDGQGKEVDIPIEEWMVWEKENNNDPAGNVEDYVRTKLIANAKIITSQRINWQNTLFYKYKPDHSLWVQSSETYAPCYCVLVGKELYNLVEHTVKLTPRSTFRSLETYLQPHEYPGSSLCAIEGLNSTGKTMMIWQAIAHMSDYDRSKSAYIRVNEYSELYQMIRDIINLYNIGYRFIFIDFDPVVNEQALLNNYVRIEKCVHQLKWPESENLKIIVALDTISYNHHIFTNDFIDQHNITIINTSHIPQPEWCSLMGLDNNTNYPYAKYGGVLYHDPVDLIVPRKIEYEDHDRLGPINDIGWFDFISVHNAIYPGLYYRESKSMINAKRYWNYYESTKKNHKKLVELIICDVHYILWSAPTVVPAINIEDLNIDEYPILRPIDVYENARVIIQQFCNDRKLNCRYEMENHLYECMARLTTQVPD